jgi:hypothetical protein
MTPPLYWIRLGPFSRLSRLMYRTNYGVGIPLAPRLPTPVSHSKKVRMHRRLTYCADAVQDPGIIALLRSSTLLPALNPSHHKASAPTYVLQVSL